MSFWAGFFAVFGFGAFAFVLFSLGSSDPDWSDPLRCVLFERPITSMRCARFEAGSKLARTCVPSLIEERSLLVDPLLSMICVLSSTVSVIGLPPREEMLMLLPSESTFETRPTARFRFVTR